jgi:hypothetical protein
MKLTIDMKTLLEDNQAMMKSKNESVAWHNVFLGLENLSLKWKCEQKYGMISCFKKHTIESRHWFEIIAKGKLQNIKSWKGRAKYNNSNWGGEFGLRLRGVYGYGTKFAHSKEGLFTSYTDLIPSSFLFPTSRILLA